MNVSAVPNRALPQPNERGRVQLGAAAVEPPAPQLGACPVGLGPGSPAAARRRCRPAWPGPSNSPPALTPLQLSPLQSSFMQVLSPSRQAVGYPFLFAPASHHAPLFTMQDNEKFRKLMQKKQKRWVMKKAIRYRRY